MDKKRVSSELLLTSAGITWHGGLIKVNYFIGPFEFETKDRPKFPTLHT